MLAMYLILCRRPAVNCVSGAVSRRSPTGSDVLHVMFCYYACEGKTAQRTSFSSPRQVVCIVFGVRLRGSSGPRQREVEHLFTLHFPRDPDTMRKRSDSRRSGVHGARLQDLYWFRLQDSCDLNALHRALRTVHRPAGH